MDDNKLMQIFGTDELVKLFVELDKDNQSKILSTSFRKASKIIIDAAQNNLKGNYKHVSAAMGVIMKKDIQTLNVGSIKKKGGHLAHIANTGTKERAYKTKNGEMHRTGKIVGNYFWDNAITANEENVEQAIYNDIKDRFTKLIQKKSKI
jgi:hypothetical protein